ncbi:unnamed protein product [Cylindrotheca closterium]|uniref:PDZ domain-containing protein n=1 Tax=Cylindrotheca closterium TaxID=2856 RepID=A0AAD2CT12_9STRA|nr:unnamed protein product [Cylindrotheca closterium]
MAEVNAQQVYRHQLKGRAQNVPMTQYSRPSRSRQMIEESETRDDGERYGAGASSTKLPQQCRAIQDNAMISVPSEGIIQIEIARESIPGIAFSRLSSLLDAQHQRGGHTLQIDYIHAESSFSRSPLVPGLVVREINNQKMIQQSPQDAQRELVNEYYPTTRIQVYGYTGVAYKPQKSTRLGLVLKDSSTAEGVYISTIKRDSIFWGAGLKAGLKVVSINKRPCPKDILKAIKRLQRTTGLLEIVAVETKRLQGESQSEISSREEVHCSSLRQIEDVCHLEDEGPILYQHEKMREPVHIISLLHIEEPPLSQDFDIMDQNSLVRTTEDDSTDGSVESQTTITRTSNARNDFRLTSSPEQVRPYSTRKESRDASDSDDPGPLLACVDDPMLCSAFLDEVAEFVREHTAMLDKAVRKHLGKERSDQLLGEKGTSQWRVVDVRQYSQIESMPSIVVGSVDHPTPPMMLGIASARPCYSPLYDKVINKNKSLVSVKVPQDMMLSGASRRRDISATSRPRHSQHGLEEDPGLIVTGLEMNFTDKAVFVAKDSKRVRGGDNIAMAVLLFADNTLLKMDKVCFSQGV